MLRCTPNFHNLIFTSCIGNIPLWKERKTVMKWGKTNCGDQRNCGNRLIFLIDVEMDLKKRLKKEEEEELKKKEKWDL